MAGKPGVTPQDAVRLRLGSAVAALVLGGLVLVLAAAPASSPGCSHSPCASAWRC